MISNLEAKTRSACAPSYAGFGVAKTYSPKSAYEMGKQVSPLLGCGRVELKEDHMRKAMIAEIYKPADGLDCTNKGVTSNATKALIVGPVLRVERDTKTEAAAIPEIFVDRGTYPVLRLEIRHDGSYVVAVPADIPEGTWTMFGGNFVYTPDSRLRDICAYPIPVHDRIERAEVTKEVTR